MKKSFVAFVCFLSALWCGVATAGESRTLCVYDPSGANGDAYATMKDYQVAASQWGVDFKLKPIDIYLRGVFLGDLNLKIVQFLAHFAEFMNQPNKRRNTDYL